jgi:hypothetical protein
MAKRECKMPVKEKGRWRRMGEILELICKVSEKVPDDLWEKI